MDNEFSFPYPPYGIQLKLMNEIKECIENKQIGIFESPTGTGKSLSVICSTMTWLEEVEKKERIDAEKLVGSREKKEEERDSDDWIADYKRKLEKSKDVEDAKDRLEYLRRVEDRILQARDNIVSGRKRRAHASAEDEDKINLNKENKDDDEVAPPEDYDSNEEDVASEEQEEPLKVTKIFYASRTHSQLEQIVDELQKTRFRPRVVTAASRQTLCANDDVRKLKLGHLVNEKCMELRKNGGSSKKSKGDEGTASKKSCKQSCSYYKQSNIEEVMNGILAANANRPSSVYNTGRQAVGCPYFASRNSIPMCQLVLLPYQVALHEDTRAAWGIDLKDNVLILDEAHNVLQTVGSLYSAELSSPAITLGLRLVRQYIDTYRLRLKAKNLLYMRHLAAVLERLDKYIRAETSKEDCFTIQSFLIKLSLTDVNIFKLVHYIKSVDLCRKFHGFFLRYQKGELNPKVAPRVSGVAKLLAANKQKKENEKSSGTTVPATSAPAVVSENRPIPSPLFAVKQFLECLCFNCDYGRVVVEKTKDAARYRFILLNPAAKLVDTLKLARATVLVGGTMEPSQLLIDCLHRGGVEPQKIRRFSCSHVIGDDQLCALAIGRTIENRPFTLTYQTRSDQTLIRSLAETLLQLVGTVPNGVVAFFPSYDYLAFFMESIKRAGLMAKFQDVKSIVVEERGPNSSQMWERFAKCAKTTKGALLCAVVGGKLSEGINFSDDLGRAVVMIGLPYPNKNSVELKEKMKFLESALQGSGAQLYESLCMHSVNQAVGRAIRHRNDYAAVFLIDARFGSPNVSSQLSKWIGSRLRRVGTAQEALTLSRQFFADQKKKKSV